MYIFVHLYLQLFLHFYFTIYIWGMETFFSLSSGAFLKKFLSYLWGMETVRAIDVKNVTIFSSYPTYEEWKRRKREKVSREKAVLILPMRNGNLVSHLPVFKRFLVLILPMRNGNFVASIWSSMLSALFLSYLWGMETRKMALYIWSWNTWFLSYLWGMETC